MRYTKQTDKREGDHGVSWHRGIGEGARRRISGPGVTGRTGAAAGASPGAADSLRLGPPRHPHPSRRPLGGAGRRPARRGRATQEGGGRRGRGVVARRRQGDKDVRGTWQGRERDVTRTRQVPVTTGQVDREVAGTSGAIQRAYRSASHSHELLSTHSQ